MSYLRKSIFCNYFDYIESYRAISNQYSIDWGMVTRGSGSLAPFLGCPLGKTLWLHTSSVSQSVCQTFSIRFLHCSYLFNAMADQVHMRCAYAL